MLTAENKVEILALFQAFNHAIDIADADGWLATWTPDGAFRHPAHPNRGLAELKDFITRRNAELAAHPIADQRHWNADIVLDEDGDGVTSSCLLLVSGKDKVTGRPIVAVQGRFRDSLVETSEGWRFTERALVVDYVTDVA